MLGARVRVRTGQKRTNQLDSIMRRGAKSQVGNRELKVRIRISIRQGVRIRTAEHFQLLLFS
jgi:hypothetical protein